VGGQVLVSESVRDMAGNVLRIDAEMSVLPKGAEKSIKIYDVGGIAGDFNVTLMKINEPMLFVSIPIPLQYTTLEGKHVGRKDIAGTIVILSGSSAAIDMSEEVESMTNIRINLADVYEELAAKDFYAKVMDKSNVGDNRYIVRFTSMPPEVYAYLQAYLKHSAKA